MIAQKASKNNDKAVPKSNPPEQIRLFLDGKTSRHHESFDLLSKGETLRLVIVYHCKNDDNLDLDFTVNHLAKNTHSELYVYGLLDDRSKKTCHLKINFKKGCAGSTGIEREEVYLLSDQAKNTSEPTILCSEEDVKGSHGATIGHLDNSKKHYLMSRGLTENEAKKALECAHLYKSLTKITDKTLKTSVKNALNNVQYI